MSDEADVEQLLENFQKALDTLNNIGNVEALITKLDANKNRRLLKKVKHIVGEVHNKVGTVKEKVSKAYKRVKLLSSSESEDVFVPGNTDKEASDKNSLGQSEDVSVNIDGIERYSPIIGRKEKHFKRSTRLTDKLQNNKDAGNECLENLHIASDGESKRNTDENDDVTIEDKEDSLEKSGQEMDVDDVEAYVINSEDIENRVDADDNQDQTDNEDKEQDTEPDSSQDVIEGTPVKPNKISLSLNKNKNKSKDEISELTNTSNSEAENKRVDNDKEGEDEDSNSDAETSRNGRKKNKSSKHKEKHFSDSDEETDKTLKKLRGKKDNKKDWKSKNTEPEERSKVTSDSDEDDPNSAVDTSRSHRRKDKTSRDKEKDFSDSNEGYDKTSREVRGKKKDNSDISDDEEEKLTVTKRDSGNKESKNCKLNQKAKDPLDSDAPEKMEEDKNDSDISDDEEDKFKDIPKKSGSKKSKNTKSTEKSTVISGSDEAENIEEHRSDSDIEILGSHRKKDKTTEDQRKNISDSEEENDKTSKKLHGTRNKKVNKNKGDNDVSDGEEEKLKDTSKSYGGKKSNTSKRKEKPNSASDSDETDKSTDNEADQPSDNDSDKSNNEEKNKKDSEVSNKNVAAIDDMPEKANSKKDKDENSGKGSSDSEAGEPTLIENAIKNENVEKTAHPPIPKIKLVDINKLLAPNKVPLDVMTPSPKTKKCVTFDSSVIILSSSDEETPKKDPKNKDRPLKSALRQSLSKKIYNSDSDSKENNENHRNRRSTRQSRKENKVLTSDHSSDDSDFQQSRRSRRLRRHEEKTKTLKEKFSKLATKYGERKCRVASRRLGRDEDHSDKEDANNRKKKKGSKEKVLDSDNDSEKDSTSVRNKKRQRKKDLLETSSLSEQSDHSDGSDSVFEVSSKKKSSSTSRSNVKKAKVSYPEADINDPKFKAGVFIRLPLFPCEELPDIYKRKKELFEVKKLTKMDFTRRTRSARNGSSKKSDDLEKPEKKRIKLTLKLNRKHKPKEDSSDDERSSTEENKDVEVEKEDAGKKDKKKKEKENVLHVDPLDVPDGGGAKDSLAEACLEQIKDNSDKEESDNQDEKSDSNEDDTKKKSKNKKKKDEENKKSKDKENKDKESDEESATDTEKKSAEEDKDEEPKVNGVLSDGEEESDKNQKDDKKDKKDESSDEEDDDEKKKGKNWKNDKLLKEKIDSSDSDDDFANFSKKKDKSNSELVRKAKKRIKKSTVISDSDSDKDNDEEKKKNEGSDYDEDFRASEKSSSDTNSDSEKEGNSDESDKEEKKKPARKRIKRVKDSSSDDDDKSTRKHIRRMIDRDSLSETTKRAAQDEKDRKARIAEKQKKYNQIFALKADATVEKVVLDYDEKTDEPLLSISPKLAKQFKPHQVLGVKFMWDACFESLARAKKNAGSGCILAHCMGLGKTLQVIALSHALLTNSKKTKVEKIMVVCPVNTVLNWKSEFKKWIPRCNEFEVYELVSCKTSSINHERNYVVREWHENGGVLIIGYNMFRTLSNPENKSIAKKLRDSFHEGLVDPGPDLVVCDEGHLLKNEKTHLSIAMNRIKTPRRIVLTGTPLQNNLKEYWCMVQFIKPNLLGTYKEYMNRFVNPIINGQYTDSTQHDIAIMRRRSHVLHKLLDGVVQRQDYSVLEPYLPPKYEYVLFLKLTDVQIKLYTHYMDNFARRSDGSNRTSFLFTDFQQLQRMCTHPRVLLDKSVEDKEKKDMNEESESEGSLKDFIDDDESEAVSTSSGSDGSGSRSGSDTSIKSDEKKKKEKKTNVRRKRVTRAQAAQKRDNGKESDSDVEVIGPKEWWQEYIDHDELDNINHSAKIFLLFEILKECEAIGDKVLVFSQSLYTLNCIEYFLQRIAESTQRGETEKVGEHSGSWGIGLDYFRLDGSSSCDNRASWCDQFNNPNNTRARLFLISTKAGGLGINLVAANRVIIFDVSWNPSHDVQSIYRVYRFGQTKPSYVYRFVTYGAMEMKIYERQVTKQAISKRVIDEQQIDRHYSQNDIQELYKTDLEPKERPIPMVPKDVLLGELLQKYENTIFKYHEHQSLLENKQDEELNEEERKAAWEEFENEKVIRKTTLTNFGGINLAVFQNQMNFSPQLIQVALANIVRKDNPAWSDVQIRGILPALVTQLQMQMSENDFSMYNRVQQEIRLMQQIQAERMREQYLQQYQLQQILQKQQLTNQMLGNLNVTPEELRRLQSVASQNYIQPPPPRSTAGGSGDVIELND